MNAYPYGDENGNVVYRVVRYGNKSFRHEHPADGNGRWESGRGDGKLYPYRLREVLRAIDEGQPVYICEGEKDAETAYLQGVAATTNSGGAGKWNDEHSTWLRGAEPIYLIWDNDQEGKRHALKVAASLRRLGISDIRFRRAAKGKDLTDHIEAGLTLDDLVKEKPADISVAEKPDAPDDSEIESGIFQLVKSRVEGLTREAGKPNQFNAICPAHDDTSPSLSVSLGDRGQVTVHCHAGCTFEEIAAALKIRRSDLSRGSSSDGEQVYKIKQRLRNTERAKFELHMEKQRNIVVMSDSDSRSGVDELAIPDEDTTYLFDSWFPNGSMVLLNADRKTGKTRLCLSLAKAICDGEPFLGKYATTMPDGSRVLYLNYEMTAGMFRRWFRESAFAHPENFLVQNLKGRSLPFHDTVVRDALAAYCIRMNVVLIIFDTQIKAMADLGVNENDNSEVTGFHTAIEALVEQTGGSVNVLLAHHIGKSDREHGRGASRIEDGVDVIWTLVKDGDGGDGSLSKAVPRLLRGEGREVLQPAVQLVYNDETGLYTCEGVSLAAQAQANQYEDFCKRLEEHYAAVGRWPTTREARPLTGVGAGARKGFIEGAVAAGYIRRIKSRDSTAIRYRVQ